jgi:hypothetical protein
MAAYLDVPGFRVSTAMLGEDVDLLETRYPGFLDAKLREESGWIDGRLQKRYATHFAAPVPAIVEKWLVAIVTLWAYKKRGFDALSPEGADTIKDAETAKAEVKEAADADEGLFDLPLRDDVTSTGIARGGPIGYSEADPYSWLDRQVEAVRGS